MVYGIGQAHKLRKQNRKKLDNTTDSYSSPSTPSYSYNKLSEYTDISRKTFTAETHSSKICALDDKYFVIIQKNMYPTHTQKTC